MAPQAAGDVGKDRLPVLQFDRECGTWEDLLYRPEEFERGFF